MSKQEILTTLRARLQTAIMLEYATLPPYLTALWSIHGTSDHAESAKRIILSVIQEEMLHMAMACNVLNAIGGKPRVNDPTMLPTYPCMLPGHSKTNNAFLVHVNRCCPESIENFMQIELPHTVVAEPHHEDGWSTIGEFYDEIEDLIRHDELDDEDFSYGKQIESSYNPGKGTLYTVRSRADALTALDEIIDQGEGHDQTQYDNDGELTHYWKFSFIRDLMLSGGWKYTQDVHPVRIDPDETLFTAEARRLDRVFNEIYSDLLDEMQREFTNEEPSLEDAIEHMFKLRAPAVKLMQIPLIDGRGTAAPTFRYIPRESRSGATGD